jgi:hypothetical protein
MEKSGRSHVVHAAKMKNAYNILAGKTDWKKNRSRYVGNSIKECEIMN